MNSELNSNCQITLIVGHRGTGKTSLLHRIEQYFMEAGMAFVGVDLDLLIEEATGRHIPNIFASDGEEKFRQMEIDTLNLLLEKWQTSEKKSETLTHIYVSLGAGFKGPIPPGTEVLFVERSTDANGRIFMNRPRLDEAQTALEEFHTRKQTRDIQFSKWKTQSLTLLEGFSAPYTAEKNFILQNWTVDTAAITLLPEDFSSTTLAPLKLRPQLINSNFKYFELRDDLLEPKHLKSAIASLPSHRILASFRSLSPAPELLSLVAQGSMWDWPLELGNKIHSELNQQIPKLVSLHERKENESLSEALNRLEQMGKKSFLKAALMVDSFADLAIGHRWYLADPKQRCFLPRSDSGRWSWYRLLMKDKFAINFIREGLGSSADQPLLLEWMNHSHFKNGFAAILGSPVNHSHTPAEHFNYFDALDTPVLRIDLKISEWRDGAIDFLTSLGLAYAAVTSPLKTNAFTLCQDLSPTAKKFASVNTIFYQKKSKRWSGHNTDIDGLEKLFGEIPAITQTSKGSRIAVWGGGGTLPLIKDLLPDADYFSARTGQLRTLHAIAKDYQPEVLIMASGRGKDIQSPPPEWKPKQVVDLNYTDHSPGIEYAQITGSLYTSGELMFKTQAQHQREFFTRLKDNS